MHVCDFRPIIPSTDSSCGRINLTYLIPLTRPHYIPDFPNHFELLAADVKLTVDDGFQ